LTAKKGKSGPSSPRRKAQGIQKPEKCSPSKRVVKGSKNETLGSPAVREKRGDLYRRRAKWAPVLIYAGGGVERADEISRITLEVKRKGRGLFL